MSHANSAFQYVEFKRTGNVEKNKEKRKKPVEGADLEAGLVIRDMK